MIRRQTLQVAFVVLSFTTIVFTSSSARDGGTQYWYLFFSPLVIAASFYGVRGALLVGAATFVTLVLLYRNALITLQSLPFDTQAIADLLGRSPTSRILGGELNNSLFGTAVMLVGAVGIGYLGDRSRRLERQVAFMADHDPLTGLFNRRRFTTELEREAARCRATGDSSVLLYIDLDGFKQVNDQLGHDRGDQLLRDISVIFRDQVRAEDVIGRMGGDEFALLMPGVDAAAATAVTSRLLQAVESYSVVEGGTQLHVTASIGAVRLPGRATPDGRQLLIHADEAMYLAKRGGKNQARIAQPTTGVPAVPAAQPAS